MRLGLGINLENYLNALSKAESKEYTILSYINIKEHIKNYLEPTSSRGEFPDPFYEPLTPPPSSPLPSENTAPSLFSTFGEMLLNLAGKSYVSKKSGGRRNKSKRKRKH